MNSDSTVTFAFLFSVISTIGVFYSIYSSSKAGRKKEENDHLTKQAEEMRQTIKNVEQFTKINCKLDQLNITTKNIQMTNEVQNNEMKEVNKTLTNLNKDITTLFEFKKDTEDKIKEHEKEINNIKTKIGGNQNEN